MQKVFHLNRFLKKIHFPLVSKLILSFTYFLACKQDKKHFSQCWEENMSIKHEEVLTEWKDLKDFDGQDYTLVSFQPDFDRFKMEKLDDVTIALFSR